MVGPCHRPLTLPTGFLREGTLRESMLAVEISPMYKNNYIYIHIIVIDVSNIIHIHHISSYPFIREPVLKHYHRVIHFRIGALRLCGNNQEFGHPFGDFFYRRVFFSGWLIENLWATPINHNQQDQQGTQRQTVSN